MVDSRKFRILSNRNNMMLQKKPPNLLHSILQVFGFSNKYMTLPYLTEPNRLNEGIHVTTVPPNEVVSSGAP